jgi:predicted homoserine dehydrogenase-like protein
MIIIDRALQERQAQGKPIKVAMIGAGVMGKGIALQIIKYTPGINLVAISNRHLSKAIKAYNAAGTTDYTVIENAGQLEDAIKREQPAVTENALALCQADGVDAVIEVTGDIQFGLSVALEAIRCKKHLISFSAELDGTLGPLLKAYADNAGVIYTNADGDQPGVIMNLYRFVKGIGIKPVLCGAVKGFYDPYRNPTTQKAFAEKWGQKPHMVTSYADGTKLSFEQAIVANATGMRVAKRGMYGPAVKTGTPIEETVNLFPLDDLREGPGIIDYVVGAHPNPGVFVLGTIEDPVQRQYLSLYKLGDGPLYCFYRPYHLCHFEVHNSVARAVLFKDATIDPLGAPRVEVVTTAKIDLQAGQILDGIGYYMIYGQCENADITTANNLLPIGVAEGCKLKRNIARDEVITYDDVELPARRLIDKMRVDQQTLFSALA